MTAHIWRIGSFLLRLDIAVGVVASLALLLWLGLH
jgi:hypothetical protein